MHSSALTLYKGCFGHLEPQQKKTLEAIIRNCVYLDLQNVDLEDLASLKSEVDLVRDVVEPVLSRSELQDNFRRMRIRTEFRSRPMPEADPNLLQIVDGNLLNNAVKYGRDETEIALTVWEERDRWQPSVWNQGVGISAGDIANRPFQKRMRLRQEGTEGVKGNGLDLSNGRAELRFGDAPHMLATRPLLNCRFNPISPWLSCGVTRSMRHDSETS